MTGSRKRYSSVFVSDIHLGTRWTKPQLLIDFLERSEFDRLYLVGDIVDMWRLSHRWYWPKEHTETIEKIVASTETITYVIGNHDEFLRSGRSHDGFSRTPFFPLLRESSVVNDCIHTGLDGKRYLVIHGDRFDVVTQNLKWLAHVGDVAYDALLLVNSGLFKIRDSLGLPYWSLSGWVKRRVKSVVNMVGHYEKSLSEYAAKRRVDGVICGHIHSPCVTRYGEVEYMNCGDMIDSCSLLVENVDGSFEILYLNRSVR